MNDEHDYPLMGRLSQLLGHPVYRVPNGHGTCSDGTHIWLESRYAEKIRAIVSSKSLPLRCKDSALAVYVLLHEEGHLLQSARGEPYRAPASEIDANKHAAFAFQPFLRVLGCSQQTITRAWRALPDYYRNPEAV